MVLRRAASAVIDGRGWASGSNGDGEREARDDNDSAGDGELLVRAAVAEATRGDSSSSSLKA